MPVIRHLTNEELEEVLRPQRRMDLSPYENLLRTIEPGKWTPLVLEDGEPVQRTKRRLNQAARDLQKSLRYKKFKRTGAIAFQVEPA